MPYRIAEPTADFTAPPPVVAVVAEATRLSYGHLCNPAVATEVSLIDPLPHQRIAVYERMLGLSPLRFLLADDAGARKTIMTGPFTCGRCWPAASSSGYRLCRRRDL